MEGFFSLFLFELKSPLATKKIHIFTWDKEWTLHVNKNIEIQFLNNNNNNDDNSWKMIKFKLTRNFIFSLMPLLLSAEFSSASSLIFTETRSLWAKSSNVERTRIWTILFHISPEFKWFFFYEIVIFFNSRKKTLTFCCSAASLLPDT